MPMSFREKSAWISILSMAGIYGYYFISVIRSGRWGDSRAGGLLGTVVALAIVQTVLTVAVAVLSPRDARAPQDERESLIALRSTRFAYGVLAGCVACACFFGGFEPPVAFGTNALLLVLVAAEVLRCGCQIIQFRRGA